MSQDMQVKRKRTRTLDNRNAGRLFLDNEQDPLISDMLARQSTLLQNNLTDSSYASAGDEAHDDDDVIFIKEQPIEFTDNNNYTAKKFKKQRTISLPQLPYARLLYNAKSDIPRRQNDDDLVHLSGSSSKTIDGNKMVSLQVVRSVSPITIDAYNEKKKLSASKITKLVTKKKKKEFFQTDKDGHYIFQENDVFSNGRFIVKQLLGQGTFGKVVKCIDTLGENAAHLGTPTPTPSEYTTPTMDPYSSACASRLQAYSMESPISPRAPAPKYVAVKIIRAVDRYREAAKTELRVLQTILANDPQGQYQCLLLLECFDYKNHICLVTDLFGKSVYDFMCNNGCPRFPGSHVQAVSKQLIRSVCFLHDLGIIHTDLKPENILLCDESFVEKQMPPGAISTMSPRRQSVSGGKRRFLTNPEVKLIDFGSAVFHNEYHPAVISTRHYRAPEIVLGLGWSFPCDIWSIGCVLVELVTGESLYPIHENLEHMAMMQRINGVQFPQKMVEKMFYKVEHKLGNLPPDLNTTVVRHFDKDGLSLQWPERNNRGEVVTKEKSMKRVMSSCDRLDKYISQKLKADYGEWLKINWEMSPEENWNYIEMKYVGHKLDRELFLFWYWFVDLCRMMFEFDPTKRITAREAMEHEWFSLGILDEGITSFGKF